MSNGNFFQKKRRRWIHFWVENPCELASWIFTLDISLELPEVTKFWLVLAAIRKNNMVNEVLLLKESLNQVLLLLVPLKECEFGDWEHDSTPKPTCFGVILHHFTIVVPACCCCRRHFGPSFSFQKAPGRGGVERSRHPSPPSGGWRTWDLGTSAHQLIRALLVYPA